MYNTINNDMMPSKRKAGLHSWMEKKLGEETYETMSLQSENANSSAFSKKLSLELIYCSICTVREMIISSPAEFVCFVQFLLSW